MAKKPKITKIVTFTATLDGVQASAPTEKEAIALLHKVLAERKATAQ